jgi:thiol-disulfide isomerase/thioredoxin
MRGPDIFHCLPLEKDIHMRTKAWILSLLLTITALNARSAGPAPTTAPLEAQQLAGTWLVESASWTTGADLVRAKAVLTDHSFALTGFCGRSDAWTGTYSLGPGNSLDMHTEAYDIAYPGAGTSLIVPSSDVQALYRLDRDSSGDRLTICYSMSADQPRPAAIKEADGVNDPRLITLVRADAGFVDFPSDIILTVLDPNGNPVKDACPLDFMQYCHPASSKDGKTFTIDMSKPAVWSYSAMSKYKTATDGTVRIPFKMFENRSDNPFAVREAAHGHMAFIHPSAAALQRGRLTAILQPVRAVRGSIVPDAELPYFYPTVSLSSGDNGGPDYLAEKGSFDFPVPPGIYRLRVNAQDVYAHYELVTIPPGTGEFVLPSVKVHVSEGPSIAGHPAPPLEGVVAWKNGGPVDLAAFKGKVVLVNFWGYWCGGCVNEMPTLFHLYDKYQDRGLMIVSVHIDANGEVDTVAKLDERTARYRQGFWRGRDVPFPTALASGAQSGKDRTRVGAAFGVIGYPTTVVIGRDGNVIGQLVGASSPSIGLALDLESESTADASVEKLLGE